MKVDKLTEDRLKRISGYIEYAAIDDKEHIPDKIACLKACISLIDIEIKKLKKLHILSQNEK